ncbi:MAG: histidine phosphatase family protein, partial [Synechococcus sp.]|nr:histidine phosphatase family protein [Synechococcus sp.]
IAEERSPTREDASRALTEAGRERTRAVLQRALALGLTADRLSTSPLVRARQTAEIARAVGLAAELEVSGELAPGGDPFPLIRRWLAAGGAPGRLLLVGHEPDLGLLAARLIGAAPGSLPLRKAGLALLALPVGAAEAVEGSAELRLLLSPRVLLGERRG